MAVVMCALALHSACAQDGDRARETPDRLAVRIANTLRQPRAGEPVSFGFPVPESLDVRDVATLRLVDDEGGPVAAQFKALSRWGAPRDSSAPLKWVLATCLPALGPASVTDFTVTTGPASETTPIPHRETAEGDAVVVAPAEGVEIEIPLRTFAPLGESRIGDRVVTGAGSLEMVDAEGAPVRPEVTSATSVEESGPLRLVLVQRGALGDLRYTCRWYFHAGRPEVAVEFRLENPLAYGIFDEALPDGQRYFDRLALVLPVAGSGHAVTSPLGTTALPAGGSWELTQRWRPGNPLDVESGFAFSEALAGESIARGGRHPGAVDVSGDAGGVTIVVERFSENHPKAFDVRDGAVRVALFPSFGNGPEFRGQYATPASTDKPVDPAALEHYRFEGGRWKSHRLVFELHHGTRSPADVAAAAARVESPPVGYPDPALVRTSRALGILWAERDILPREPSIERFERFFDIMADDSSADPTGHLGRIGLPLFLSRGGTYGGREPYGWENFGDIPWGSGWCNLHYDWPAAMLSGFLRTGDVRLFTRGCDMARFRRDYGQNHSQDAGEAWRGAAFYEKGWWHGNAMPGTVSHNWILGLLLHYALTGDEGTREAALENASMVMRAGPGRWSGYWGSRIPGWAIDCLVDAWNFLGDQECLDEAARGIRRYEELELGDGALGYHLNPANGATTVWMENIFFIGAAKHALATGDPLALPLLGRMRSWFKRSCILPPQGGPGGTTLPAVFEQWNRNGGSRPSVHHVWDMVAALSYATAVLHDPDDRRWATILFESNVRYWQEGASGRLRNPLDGASWSPITMRPLAYPNSESKVLANVLNFGAPHLALRAGDGAPRR